MARLQTIGDPPALGANIACLGGRNTDLAEAIGATAGRDDVSFVETPQGVPAVIAGGAALCSRHSPLDEGRRLVEGCDLVEHAVMVVLGFGAGYHVRALGERLAKSGVIVVFEPDVALLRSVMERIDHSRWLSRTNVVWVTDPDDRGTLGAKLMGAESIVAQGVELVVHPASRGRLGDAGRAFLAMFQDYVGTAKTTLLTTLMRSVDTVRNLLLNLDHYAGGDGAAELAGAARGHPAVVVSAGPSLRRNIDVLARPGVRDRCVIVAAQTTLRPLLDAGVRPHFVTALDFHEISRRFYAGLEPGEVADVTLLADPKAHPVILDSFPGPLRCCESPFLDQLLGPLRRPMGAIPAGATVAHLALYTAHFLGCDPILMVGQDLAFTDGLYYAPGTAIGEVWAPELNPFNTIEMMEWQRIVRHRVHLSRREDVHGRPVYTDAQMLAYLQQFEREFARLERSGVTVIDATEGGLPKQHTIAMPLAEALERHATRPLPPLPLASRQLDRRRLAGARERAEALREDVRRLRTASERSAAIIERMLADQADPARMARHFEAIERERRTVAERFEAFEILNNLNQLGAFKRFKADRRLEVQRGLDAPARQRAQLERDLVNVVWLRDAADEMAEQLAQSAALLAGADPPRPESGRARLLASSGVRLEREVRIAAIVPVDPDRSGLGVRRSLAEPFGGRPVIQATLERLGRSRELASIVLLCPEPFDVEALIDRAAIGLPVEIERTAGSPFGPEQAAIAAARAFSATSWRGGIAGMSVYDEVLCPGPMLAAMRSRGVTAAVLVAPDWPLVDPGGIDAVAIRHKELPDHHTVVFTQAPPGLGGCIVNDVLMEQVAGRNRLSTVGALLVYQPHAPQHDPIARTANVQIDERVARSRVRATFDAMRYRSRLERLGADLAPAEVVERLEAMADDERDALPQHAIVELTTERPARGLFAESLGPPIARPPMAVETARRLFEQLADAGDAAVTLGGLGDPLMHDRVGEVVAAARDAGIAAVHVRTELRAPRAVIERLLACAPDVISVDLHADTPSTYRAMMGADQHREVIENVQLLLSARRPLTGHAGTAAIALPWIVPRLQRRAETLAEIDPFFDRWQAVLGTAVIEGLPPRASGADALTPAEAPHRVGRDELRRRMLVRADGHVPVREDDPAGACAGDVATTPLADLWAALCAARRDLAGRGDSGGHRTQLP